MKRAIWLLIYGAASVGEMLCAWIKRKAEEHATGDKPTDEDPEE